MHLRSRHKPSKFEPPTEEEMQCALVRLDSVEAWSASAFRHRHMPVYSASVRHAVIGLLRDGRVVYSEDRGLGRWKTVWCGSVDDLDEGPPPPTPRLRSAKSKRVQHAQELRVSIIFGGQSRVMCFTGVSASHEHAKALATGKLVVENVPYVGTVASIAEAGITQARQSRHHEDAAAAADVWRSILAGTLSPDALPLLAETRTRSQRRPAGESPS